MRKSYPDAVTISYLIEEALGHPAMATRTNLLKEELYDETLSIASDWKFYLRKALRGSSFMHINAIVSAFDMNGVSTVNMDKAIEEMKLVVSQEVSPCILRDCEKLKQLEDVLAYGRNGLLISYDKRKLYHNMMTALIVLFRFMDKVISVGRKV